MILTTEKLIEILKQQPKGTKVLLEDFNGTASDYLYPKDVIGAWEREADSGRGKENVMMFTKYRE